MVTAKLLSLTCACAWVCGLNAIAPGAAPAEELLSAKDALAREVHGETRLKKNQVQISYDFRSVEQAKDFEVAGMFGFDYGGLPGAPREVERPTVVPGQMSVKDWVVARLPLSEVQQVSVTAQGTSSFSIRLSQGEKQVTVNFGDFPSISFDNDGLGFGDMKRVLNLQPAKSYRFELILKGGKATGKLDGKTVLEEPIPKELGPVSLLRFGKSFGRESETCKITGLLLHGTISDDLPLLASNRDRAQQKLPPLWKESFPVQGSSILVVSPVSAEHASQWSAQLNGLVQLFLEHYPVEAPAPAPAPGGPETPIDRKAGEFRYARTVFLFSSAEVLRAYAGPGPEVTSLPSGDFAYLDHTDAQTEQRQRTLYWHIASQLLEKMYATAPYWWTAGNCWYYANPFGSGVAIGATPADFVKSARDHLESSAEPRLSHLLEGWTWSQGQGNPIGVCWAWVHFLRHGEDGTHAGLLGRFHAALRAGKSAKEAGEEVFPTAVFNDLYPRFQKYLAGL